MSRVAEMTTSAVINREKGGQIKRGGKESAINSLPLAGYMVIKQV
ncbi:hypothetical protein [Pseudobutyrivibrio xylanivorans]|nr:hypothetical protein [Pseudobutyrivibrio xylanivorans]